MENHRRITEEDLRVTEALIAKSYGRLKKRVVQVPANVLVPVSRMISEHPLEATATAVGGGIAAYGLARMATSGSDAGSGKKHKGKKKKNKRRSDPVSEIISALLPLAFPYLAAYIEKYLGTGKNTSR